MPQGELALELQPKLLRVLETRVRRGLSAHSAGRGGNGRYRGGDGIVRSLELLTDARVTLITERRARGPYGLAGGEPGQPGENRVRAGAAARSTPLRPRGFPRRGASPTLPGGPR